MTTTLRPLDLLLITRRLPSPVRNILKEYPNRVFLAGGFIRSCISGEEVSDIDLIVDSKDLGDLISRKLKEQVEGSIYTTENAFTVIGYRHPVQIIHRWTYKTALEVIESFDFTIACAAVCWEGTAWVSVIHRDYYADLAARRLVYLSPKRAEEPGGSLLRVLKFYQRGYRIPLDSLGAVIARLARAVRGDPATLEEEMHAKIVTGLLREVDPFVDPDHFAHHPATTESTS